MQRTENFCRFVVGGVDDPRFELRTLKGILQGTTAPLVVVAWLIAASVIGSDWQSRTITTVLTWQPRPVPVLPTKAVACILVACAFAVLAQVLLGLALLPATYLNGTTAGADREWFAFVVGVLLRGTGLVATSKVCVGGWSSATPSCWRWWGGGGAVNRGRRPLPRRGGDRAAGRCHARVSDVGTWRMLARPAELVGWLERYRSSKIIV